MGSKNIFSRIRKSLSEMVASDKKTMDHKEYIQKLEKELEIAKGQLSTKEEKQIIRGLVKFSNTIVKQIMKSRMDMAALDIEWTYEEAINKIAKAGFSRFPVYRDTIDKIEGILHIKDLFPFTDKGKDFNWQQLIRPCEFIPETKKIQELLKELQVKHLQVAIVVDEYGGTSGLITMEDILEEIVGEINDEFDDEDEFFTKGSDGSYLFEAKISLNDFFRALDIDANIFEEVKGESESLGGLLLEINSDMPELGDKITFNNFTFIIEAVDNKRIKKVKVLVAEPDEVNKENEH